MKFLVFAVSVLAVVLAQNSQSSICTPPIYNVEIYDFQSKLSGSLAVNFNMNVTVTRFPSVSLRLVYNLTTMNTFKFMPRAHLGGAVACSKENLSIVQVPLYCLSENAVNQFNRPMRIGPPGVGGINILSYDVPLTQNVTMKTFFTNSTPAFPILRQLIGPTGPYSGSLVLFTNSNVTAVPSAHLFVPRRCRR
ncbi:unnamed protein product [Lymnaea stagnalis]|uniref:Uncharacterized protein n=1 Tax=Lymnaea stagnalis TaxID=6523 RepID=A0AAV2GYD6_LYMST